MNNLNKIFFVCVIQLVITMFETRHYDGGKDI